MRILFARYRPLLIAVLLLGAIAGGTVGIYAAGRAAGREEAPRRERERQLRQLHEELEQRERAIRNRETRMAAERVELDSVRARYRQARERIVVVDTNHAAIDGVLRELPPPVIQFMQVADARTAADSLYIVSLEEWGNLWKAQAEDYRIKSELLEEELRAWKRRRVRERLEDLAAGAAAGALGAIALSIAR